MDGIDLGGRRGAGRGRKGEWREREWEEGRRREGRRERVRDGGEQDVPLSPITLVLMTTVI